jgi:lipopolysaccharide export system permease protein
MPEKACFEPTDRLTEHRTMGVNTIINRYLLKEMWPPFLINMLFFTFVFLMTKMLEIIDMIVNFQASATAFMLLMFYLMPSFLVYVVPMSVMMAVLLTFLRMSGDNEIVALKSCGIHPHRFLIPVLLFCFAGWALTSLITLKGSAWGLSSFEQLSMQIARSHIQAAIKERSFIDSFKGVVLYINRMDTRTKKIIDIFIHDQRNPNVQNTIIAPRADLVARPDQPVVVLTLYNGSINQVDLLDRSAHAIDFEKYELKLDLTQSGRPAGARSKSLKTMSLAELRQAIADSPVADQRYHEAQLKYHEKFSLPFACFALGLLAIPLGIESRTSRRSMGVVIGIVLFLFYYVMLLMGWSLGETGVYPPLLGMWMPNVVLGGLGILLYWRTAQDRPVALDKWLFVFKIWRWWPRYRARRQSSRTAG